MHTLNILSLNVNGLNSAVKRTRVLEYLHRKSISCALIQETHLKQSDVARFQNKYYKLAAFSCAQNKTKGVLILVNRKLNLTIEHLGSDEKGRFVFIRCKIYNNRLALVSIYFTFFSNRHKTFSRIDYIFLSPSLILSNSSISILAILLSDHSAVLCSVPLSDVKAKSPRWRFNISLLSNQTFITPLK